VTDFEAATLWRLKASVDTLLLSSLLYASFWLAVAGQACWQLNGDGDGALEIFFLICRSMINYIEPRSRHDLLALTPQPLLTGMGLPQERFYVPALTPVIPIPVSITSLGTFLVLAGYSK